MKISVITPTYNRGDLIDRCIRSVLNQNYDDFELIIVDDCSKDDTEDVVKRYLSDNRIKYFKLKENSGVNKARNHGIKQVSENSMLITFLDSDDEFLPNALADMISTANSYPEINCFRFRVIDSNGDEASNSIHSNKIVDFEYFIDNLFTIGEWVCTYRRKIIDNGFEYNENVKAFEVVSYLDLAKKEKQYFSDKIVRTYHIGHESISNEKMSKSKILNSIIGYELILNHFRGDIFSINKAVLARFEYILSYFYILNGETKKGLKYNWHAFTKSPLDLRFIRNLLKIIK
ncbi:glycosyltransferase family 2 protein [Sphingobacterium hotanense]|uniref:Glycosyltransferase family 2 protein n=1 Tax=Sphingobacterium hotanense TaxID=649196 RepID=A0ABT7NL01_9SPHI|nr:glycosyltransferase family 2 protein [Sphingobacterium hotanense]MDM1047936.1 glycosyltransferase family 2 protein [Sphingobacterium hotanense]